MEEDMEIQKRLDKLGSLEKEVRGLNSLSTEFSKPALDSFYQTLKKFAKVLPAKPSLTPDSIPTVIESINSAVDSGVLSEEFRCEEPMTDDDIYYLVGKMDTISKDSAISRDLKELFSSQPEEMKVEVEVSKTPSKTEQMMSAMNKGKDSMEDESEVEEPEMEDESDPMLAKKKRLMELLRK